MYFCYRKKLGFFLLGEAVVLFNSHSYWTGSLTKYNEKKTIYNVIKMRAKPLITIKTIPKRTSTTAKNYLACKKIKY